jgi:hypothetical protein
LASAAAIFFVFFFCAAAVTVFSWRVRWMGCCPSLVHAAGWLTNK